MIRLQSHDCLEEVRNAESLHSVKNSDRTEECAENWARLTKGDDDRAGDAVGHADSEDAHGPGVLQAKLELISLALGEEKEMGAGIRGQRCKVLTGLDD